MPGEINANMELHEFLSNVGRDSSAPVVKYTLLHLAEKYLEKGDKKSAVCCVTAALGMILKIKYSTGLETESITWDRDDLQKMFTEKLKSALENDIKPKIYTTNAQVFTELHSDVKTLPPEWTVVQITKRFDPLILGASNREICCKDTGICITMLRYPRWELNDKRPILIPVPSNKGNTMMWAIYELVKEIKNILYFDKENDNGSARQAYWEQSAKLESDMQKLIKEFRTWFRAWMFVLSGEFKSTIDRTMETKIFAKVDQYCKRKRCSCELRILLSLVARRLDIMSNEAIYEFCCHFSNENRELKDMFILLLEIKKDFKVSAPSETYPCLLVIDENLDYLLWEMLNVEQDLCRFSSFRLLTALCKKYNKNIKDGYLRLKVKKGHEIINPDSNLENMENRMVEFFDYWVPKWTRNVRELVPREKFAEILSENDVFVYCGHGSGLQHIKENYLMFLKIKPVTFLFGCGSTRLYPKGMWNEMTGSHVYYSAGMCPAVVGMLFVVTDLYTDIMATVILSRWAPQPDKKPWNAAEKSKTAWKECDQSKINAIKLEPEQNLLRIATDLRKELAIPIRQRAALCFRGLPVWNDF